MFDDAEWFMDWRVWGIVFIIGCFALPYMYPILLESFKMPKWKAIVLLILSVPVSYVVGKIMIEKEG